jgi:hypothetical protein
MMTLQMRNGDLVVTAKGHALVAGEAKTRQDLALAVREPYGIDRFHPEWGSLLPRYIGSQINLETEALIRAECTRIVKNLMAQQQSIQSADARGGHPNRFSTNEIIRGIASIDLKSDYDRFHVRINLTTQAKSVITETFTVAS